MNKAVLISIKPKWCELIMNGKKTVEVRKTRPKTCPPFKCYIYCTKAKNDIFWQSKTYRYVDDRSHNLFDKALNGKVIGEFICYLITGLRADNGIQAYYNGRKETCLTDVELIKYASGKMIYYWHISDLKIYDEPKELSEFRKPCIMPESPYCPCCDKGYEYISESEAEFYRIDGECSTEWVCLNYITRPPQSWCYVEEVIINAGANGATQRQA